MIGRIRLQFGIGKVYNLIMRCVAPSLRLHIKPAIETLAASPHRRAAAVTYNYKPAIKTYVHNARCVAPPLRRCG